MAFADLMGSTAPSRRVLVAVNAMTWEFIGSHFVKEIGRGIEPRPVGFV
jgi:hypothetical protein